MSISRSGRFEHVILPNIGETKSITSVDVTNISAKSQSWQIASFWFIYFAQLAWFKIYTKCVVGSTRTRISRGNLGQIIINLPGLPEQRAIANIINDMDSDIESLQLEMRKYKAIKQGMMQKLLTGQIRLVDSVDKRSN